MHHIVPVILCGGSGTRLWPLSRAGFPKQFLPLTGKESLFQQSVVRARALAGTDIHLDDLLLVMHEDHRFLALDQLNAMESAEAAHFLLEPVARNTAPALTLAALQAQSSGEDPILVVMPADQNVAERDAFTEAVQRSIRTAAQGGVVLLGIPPDHPETGYGYIRRTGQVDLQGTWEVGQFTEKPDLETAKKYLESGEYTWNGGMFVLRASVWLAALGEFRPDILEPVRSAW